MVTADLRSPATVAVVIAQPALGCDIARSECAMSARQLCPFLEWYSAGRQLGRRRAGKPEYSPSLVGVSDTLAATSP
jgi:hypothetical protein